MARDRHALCFIIKRGIKRVRHEEASSYRSISSLCGASVTKERSRATEPISSVRIRLSIDRRSPFAGMLNPFTGVRAARTPEDTPETGARLATLGVEVIVLRTLANRPESGNFTSTLREDIGNLLQE